MNDILGFVKKLIYGASDVVWGPVTILVIMAYGIYMTFKTDFFQIKKAGFILKNTLLSVFLKSAKNGKKRVSPLQAVSTALGASIGTGNIAGVATAITIGGTGAVFWMWVSAFFGMITSFSENTLGGYYRKLSGKGGFCGGAMYYLSCGIGKNSHLKWFAKILSVLFAFFCMVASLGMGNMAQANTVSDALSASFCQNKSLGTLVCGTVLFVFVCVIFVGGTKRICRISEKLVPFMSVGYILISLIVILINIKTMPEVIISIIKNAFGFGPVAGGFSGTVLATGINVGVRRGVFSNEAGLGSSVLVNSEADVAEPVEVGMWGSFEVFFDTVVICSLTAFAILTSGVVDLNTGKAINGFSGAALVTSAFKVTLNNFAGIFITLSTVFFALSTIIGWSFFGIKSVEFLFGKNGVIVYKVVFAILAFVGSVTETELVWQISDIFNGLMAVPNLIGLMFLSKEVLKIFENYKLRTFKGKKYKEPLLAYDSKVWECVINMSEF